MDTPVPVILLSLLALLLLAAAVSDLRTRTIPNGLNLAIALLAIPYLVAIEIPVWPDMAIRGGIAILLFAVFAACFHLGWMGGGDVKLITAVALWLPPGAVLPMLVMMSLAGGLLTLFFVVKAKLQKAGTPEIPYGVAIAAAAMFLIAQPILNHFP